jgi:hypothetical protein
MTEFGYTLAVHRPLSIEHRTFNFVPLPEAVMTRPILLLARLNRADLAVDAIKARLAELAEALREPTALRATRRTLAEVETELGRARAAQEAREGVQQETAGRLARAQQRLYGGQVRNPRELEDAERDVQQLRHQLAAAEDRLLEALVAVEDATARQAELRAQLSRSTVDWEARQVVLRAEQSQLLARLPGEQARQAAARQAAPAALLPLYDSLRSRKSGRAVAEIDGEECSACLVAVSPGKLAVAREGDELVYCGNCGRLIWWE